MLHFGLITIVHMCPIGIGIITLRIFTPGIHIQYTVTEIIFKSV